jgi:hypothetical protein
MGEDGLEEAQRKAEKKKKCIFSDTDSFDS